MLLSSPLIEGLWAAYDAPRIDLLVNSDTLAVARTLPHVGEVLTFSYGTSVTDKASSTRALFRRIFRKYDLCVNLTASDRSVLFALAAAPVAISAVESDRQRSWWKRLFLAGHYDFDATRHILENNTMAFRFLGIDPGPLRVAATHTPQAAARVGQLLAGRGITAFLVFHPGAQYEYKVYPEHLRNALLERLDQLGIPLVVTGSPGPLDMAIKRTLPKLENLHDFIGLTSMDELIALSDRSLGYIGADTLNMHIAAAQNKRIFAIYGPTILGMWSPWSNELGRGAVKNMPVQTYGNITLFQADMPCVACGKSGCDDHHGVSECLYRIEPDTIFKEVKQWLTTFR